MRNKQMWAMLLVCAMLVFSLAACNGPTDVTKLDPEALLQEVVQKLDDAKSYETQINFSFDVTVDDENGISQQESVEADIAVLSILEPQKDKADLKLQMTLNRQTMNANAQFYFADENGQVKVYYEVNTPPGMEEIRESIPFKSGDTIGATKDLTSNQMEIDMENPEIIGLEMLDGKEAIHIQADLDISKYATQIQEYSAESMTAEDSASLQLMLKMIGDIQEDIWVAADTHDLIKIEVDCSDQLDSLIELLNPLMESEDGNVRINDLGLKVTTTSFNSVQDFDIPMGLKAPDETKTRT